MWFDVSWELILFFAGLFFIALFMVFLHVILLSSAFRKSRQNQIAVLAALEAANKANAEMLEVLHGVNDTLAACQARGLAAVPDDDEGGGESEAPADFVYCPECSTRVEVDAFIRNINVVCPDCKKPFHIH